MSLTLALFLTAAAPAMAPTDCDDPTAAGWVERCTTTDLEGAEARILPEGGRELQKCLTIRKFAEEHGLELREIRYVEKDGSVGSCKFSPGGVSDRVVDDSDPPDAP